MVLPERRRKPQATAEGPVAGNTLQTAPVGHPPLSFGAVDYSVGAPW
jgi:hypothetical protein